MGADSPPPVPAGVTMLHSQMVQQTLMSAVLQPLPIRSLFWSGSGIMPAMEDASLTMQPARMLCVIKHQLPTNGILTTVCLLGRPREMVLAVCSMQLVEGSPQSLGKSRRFTCRGINTCVDPVGSTNEVSYTTDLMAGFFFNSFFLPL